MVEFDIKRADSSDTELLCGLLGPRFPDAMRARYRWLYQGNPHGQALVWLAVERSSGAAVGCTALFPRRVHVQGRSRMGAMGGDCYVVERCRRKGLATALHRASREQMRAGGVEFMYGPPLPRNLGALLKAGTRRAGRFRAWVRPLDGEGLRRASRLLEPPALRPVRSLAVGLLESFARSVPSGIVLEPVREYTSELDQLSERIASRLGVCCARDARYLAWRYQDSPSGVQAPYLARRDGALVGLLVLERFRDELEIIDFFTEPDAAATDGLLQAAVDQARREGGSLLRGEVSDGSPLTRRLRRRGFLPRAARDFQVLAPADEPQLDVLTDGSAWHFLSGDKDVDASFRENRRAASEAS